MSTAAVAGIETVAVYPDDDAACAHVGRADAAVRLPGAGPAAYLDVRPPGLQVAEAGPQAPPFPADYVELEVGWLGPGVRAHDHHHHPALPGSSGQPAGFGRSGPSGRLQKQ